eukprot:2947119-Lingulodinium_polyedra.AAC.1
MASARATLAEAGIRLSETELTPAPEAALRLSRSPWREDAPASSAIARPDEPAATPPADPATAELTQSISLASVEGLHGLTGRLMRA